MFFDLETTGVNIGTDRIVEISCVKVCPDGSHTEYRQRLNPEMPIPAAATACTISVTMMSETNLVFVT